MYGHVIILIRLILVIIVGIITIITIKIIIISETIIIIIILIIKKAPAPLQLSGTRANRAPSCLLGTPRSSWKKSKGVYVLLIVCFLFYDLRKK
jgi:hypothetical protein